jgi:hypothetical protein
MTGGRAPDPVWRYAKANPDKGNANKPYVDVFKEKAHSDATKFKLWLAFGCPEFIKTKALEWQTLVVGLTVQHRGCLSGLSWLLVRDAQDGIHETWSLHRRHSSL